MAKEIQISAAISTTTREKLEKHVRATGMKKGYLVEQALLHHLQALAAVNAEYVVHPKLVVSRKTGEALAKQVTSGKPNAALKKLMRDGD